MHPCPQHPAARRTSARARRQGRGMASNPSFHSEPGLDPRSARRRHRRPPPDPIHTRELLLRGVNRPRRAETELTPVRYGAYVPLAEWDDADPRDQYLAFLRATAHGLAAPPLLSHMSAAAVWDLPVLGRWPQTLEQIVPENAARSSRYVTKHRRRELPDALDRGGFLVTSVARTVVDLAADRGFACGVMAADHALREGMCSRPDLEGEITLMGSAAGCRPARDAVDFADPLAESPGESLSRARGSECGFEVPELQIEFEDSAGFIGRVDCLWREVGLVGEFDGRVKYGRQRPDEAPAEEVVWEEKRREDRLRDLGLRVVRWTWAMALDPRRFTRHLREHGVPEVPGRRRRTGTRCDQTARRAEA